jgi:hypothetical protein
MRPQTGEREDIAGLDLLSALGEPADRLGRDGKYLQTHRSAIRRRTGACSSSRAGPGACRGSTWRPAGSARWRSGRRARSTSAATGRTCSTASGAAAVDVPRGRRAGLSSGNASSITSCHRLLMGGALTQERTKPRRPTSTRSKLSPDRTLPQRAAHLRGSIRREPTQEYDQR